jgi:hypothetical protein
MYRGRAAGEFVNIKAAETGGPGAEAPGAGTASIKEKIGACMQGLSPVGTA